MREYYLMTEVNSKNIRVLQIHSQGFESPKKIKYIYIYKIKTKGH